jgi:molybdopterin synthase sulfur carrier subunit
MKAVKVFYFASLRELVGKSEDSFVIESSITGESLWSALNKDIDLPESSLLAINHEYAALQTDIHENDEVAFFPPVTGG